MGIHVLVDVDQLSDVAASEVLAIAELRREEQKRLRAERKSKQLRGVVAPAPSEPTAYKVTNNNTVADGVRSAPEPRWVRGEDR